MMYKLIATDPRQHYVGGMTSDQKEDTIETVETVGSEADLRVEAGTTTSAGRQTGATSAPQEKMKTELWNIDFGVKKSMRYHARRRAFFEKLENATRVIVAISGASAFSALMGDYALLSKIATGLVTVFALADIVLGFGRRAREQDTLYRHFSEMAADIAKIEHPTVTQISELKARRLRLEADEPNIIDALERKCWNDEAASRGTAADELQKLSLCQRLRAALY